MQEPFFPLQSAMRQMAVTGTSVSIALPSIGAQVMFHNTGSKVAYVRFEATSPVTAIGTDFPILGPSSITLTRDRVAQLYLGAVCNAGETTTLLVSTGRGVKP